MYSQIKTKGALIFMTGASLLMMDLAEARRDRHSRSGSTRGRSSVNNQ